MKYKLFLTQDQIDAIRELNVKIEEIENEYNNAPYSVLNEITIENASDVFQLFIAGVRYGVENHNKYGGGFQNSGENKSDGLSGFRG